MNSFSSPQSVPSIRLASPPKRGYVPAVKPAILTRLNAMDKRSIADLPNCGVAFYSV